MGSYSLIFSSQRYFTKILFSYLLRSCQGDSGGGLFYYNNGRWYAAGVVSYAIGCGRQAFPTVFTKTAAYIDWIRAMMNRPILT
jgi:secreted trypsin-like serine protease